jgi:hypothetical protein
MRRLTILLTWLIALPIGILAQGTTWDTASLIGSGESISGTLDEDRTDEWYIIEVPEEGTVEFIINPNHENGLDIYYAKLFRLGEDGELQERNHSDVGSVQTVFTITDIGGGVYYLNINRWNGAGAYILKYKFTACPFANDSEPNEEYYFGDLLESGKTKECRLGYTNGSDQTDNNDWFIIEVPEEGKVEFTINPNQENGLDIYYAQLFRLGEDGELKERNYTEVGRVQSVLTITDIGRGTYYLNINRWDGHGGYTLKYEFTACPYANDNEPNDEYYFGDFLESGKTKECRLGYTDASALTDNDDWFIIEVPEEGKVEFIIDPNQENGLDIYYAKLFWLDGDGALQERNQSDVGRVQTVFTITDIDKGTYYLNINRWDGHGGYTLKYKFVSKSHPGTIRGDVNGDGKVNGTDIQTVINVIVDEDYMEEADVNNDGKVNGTDIQEIINIIVEEE